jgi:hypothetical protein
MLAYKAVINKPKHVYLTRYPIENYQSIYPTKVRISTITKTSKVKIALNISNKDSAPEDILTNEYINFPDLREFINKKKVPIFIDTVHISNLMTESLGADFDGEHPIF